MDSFKILLVMIFQTVGVLSTLNCPLNETEWKVKSKAKVCQGSDVYHCLVVEDGKARTEKCKEKTLIMNGYCPIFTYDDYIHWKICNKTGCPNKHFPSDEVYKFPVCFNIESEGKDFLGRLESRQDNTLPLKIGIPVGIIAALVVAAIIVIVVMKKRRYTPTCEYFIS
ncbi:uncharacterized protein LOC134263655 [Saccostrea cucullata]|uniref:uncharacterized protein LOC134263655 n=1 Tax=Saccostrea cuccullata TaxID=36930 RepID=UPI002ED1933F